MCSFDYHFRRAMEYEDDLVWIMVCYYNLIHAICLFYSWKKKRWLKTKKIISEILALST